MLDMIDINIYENDELKHWGIEGMKWGIRRFQNPDGTLTPEGRERYLKNGNNGKKTLTEEGYQKFFNKNQKESKFYKTKSDLLKGGLIGAGVAVGSLTPMGAVAGGALGSALAIAGSFAEMDPQTKRGMTKEGGKFFYDTKTGQLTKEAKEMIFDDKTFLTDLGQYWITQTYGPEFFDVPSSPEYKVAQMSKEMSDELNKYIYKNIMPICGDMPASLYLEKEWNSDKRDKYSTAYFKYAEQLSKKYYNRAMKELK